MRLKTSRVDKGGCRVACTTKKSIIIFSFVSVLYRVYPYIDFYSHAMPHTPCFVGQLGWFFFRISWGFVLLSIMLVRPLVCQFVKSVKVVHPCPPLRDDVVTLLDLLQCKSAYTVTETHLPEPGFNFPNPFTMYHGIHFSHRIGIDVNSIANTTTLPLWHMVGEGVEINNLGRVNDAMNRNTPKVLSVCVCVCV